MSRKCGRGQGAAVLLVASMALVAGCGGSPQGAAPPAAPAVSAAQLTQLIQTLGVAGRTGAGAGQAPVPAPASTPSLQDAAKQLQAAGVLPQDWKADGASRVASQYPSESLPPADGSKGSAGPDITIQDAVTRLQAAGTLPQGWATDGARRVKLQEAGPAWDPTYKSDSEAAAEMRSKAQEETPASSTESTWNGAP